MPLITFEGSEGCGQSTQVKGLAVRLGKCGIVAAVFREPVGTAIGEAIRHLLQHSEQNDAMTPEAELLLFAASRSGQPLRFCFLRSTKNFCACCRSTTELASSLAGEQITVFAADVGDQYQLAAHWGDGLAGID